MLRGWFESDAHRGAAPAGYLIEQILETSLEPTESLRFCPDQSGRNRTSLLDGY